MKGLFLDDERNPSDVTWEYYPEGVEWTIVRDYNSFKRALTLRQWDLISFDHDLQDFSDENRERTGYDCLKFLVSGLSWFYSLQIPLVSFHTKNIVGKENMKAYWQSYLDSFSEPL